jgi:hypothetical protein
MSQSEFQTTDDPSQNRWSSSDTFSINEYTSEDLLQEVKKVKSKNREKDDVEDSRNKNDISYEKESNFYSNKRENQKPYKILQSWEGTIIDIDKKNETILARLLDLTNPANQREEAFLDFDDFSPSDFQKIEVNNKNEFKVKLTI